jgi:hypothetical protein
MQIQAHTQSKDQLTWQIHLLRRHPERLPALVLVLFIGAACVWVLFGRPLPVLAALTLLLGTAAEYLLPTTYRITPDGVTAHSLTTHVELRWRNARRALPDPSGLIVTSLAERSTLDRFRGVMLRYAPPGEPGDCASVLAAIARYAPAINLYSMQGPIANDGAQTNDSPGAYR